MSEPHGRLLVIDDEQGIRDGCRRVLAPEGYAVDTAGTITEGRQAIEAGGYDMVLLDVMMPDGRGIELLADIHQRDPDCVTAILTGYATVELAVEALKAGAYDFIAKPFSGDVLLLTVQRGLERRRLLAEARRLEAVERQAAALARDRDEIERLERFKSSFMLMVAHELRAPVVGAQSLLRTLVRGMAGELTDPQREILDRVEARHAELLDLINDLLALAASKSAPPEAQMTSVDLAPVLQEVGERFRPQAEAAGVELVVEASDRLPHIRATKDDLAMVLSNLIGNAVKYTPRGGRVTAEVLVGKDEIEVRVSDTGIGISAEDLPRLGEEFFRAGNAKQSGITGTGLGLAIVHQHLDRLGARMEVESDLGRGSTFRVRLRREA